MGIFTSIWIWLTEDEEDGHSIDFGEAEHTIIERLVDRFSDFAGVEVEDGDGNPLDIDDLPHPNAPDGGLDCVIVIYPENYTEQGLKWVITRVTNIIVEGNF